MAEEDRLPNEYQPESLREKPRKSPYDQVMYAIGEWDEVKHSSGMWAGPTPNVKKFWKKLGGVISPQYLDSLWMGRMNQFTNGMSL